MPGRYHRRRSLVSQGNKYYFGPKIFPHVLLLPRWTARIVCTAAPGLSNRASADRRSMVQTTGPVPLPASELRDLQARYRAGMNLAKKVRRLDDRAKGGLMAGTLEQGRRLAGAVLPTQLPPPDETIRGEMRYRRLGRTLEEVSLIGLGG